MRTRLLLAAILLCAYAIPVQGALFDRGNGMIYDDVLDITWLQDANLGGSMNWNNSVAWADGLAYVGFDDWRLPSMDVNMDNVIVNCGSADQADCRDNELGYMYYHNLAGTSGDDLTGNQDLFTNIQLAHWSGTNDTTSLGFSWAFVFLTGNQASGFGGGSNGVWAVRSGDVGVIPLPGSVLLLGSGVLGLVGLRRDRRRR